MIRKLIQNLQHRLAVRALDRKQREVARRLQNVFDTRQALELEERQLRVLSDRLGVRELDVHVVARRHAKRAAA